MVCLPLPPRTTWPVALACWLVLLAARSPAQQGDRAGEDQELLSPEVVVPPAPALTPAEAMATFRLQRGYRIELVAHEPMIQDPVAATFDAAGDLWVVEMRAYMRTVDAHGEREPIGRISVLHDEDGDGRMDTARVFLDDVVLPRAVLPLRGGALVIEPPHLYWCADADGDGRADGKEEILGGFEAGLENPEHAGNGLLWGLDNRIHLANDKRVLRWTPRGFVVEVGTGGGQWGITQDDRGRLYFNYNEDWLRCDLVPGSAVARLGAGNVAGLNHRLLSDRSVWPIRITPGVNRGYQKGRLVDYVLAIHTAVCGPHIYRDERLPARGDAFVCEPAGNCVRRIVLADQDARMHGANPYQAQREEFLASTDERFRPVQMFGGPDQGLYLVDMYRGVIQHRNYVTTFLRRQIEQRGLEQPTGLGRIWRVVPTAETAVRTPEPALTNAPVAGLVEALASASSVRRDLALRELVQRQEHGAVDLVRSHMHEQARAAVRIVHLAALAGLDRLTRDDLRRALRDPDAGVVAFALQHAAGHLAAGDGILRHLIAERTRDAVPTIAWHAALAYGEALQLPSAHVRDDRLEQDLAALMLAHAQDAALLELAAVAAGPRAVAVLRHGRSAVGDTVAAARTSVCQALARNIGRRRDPTQTVDTLELAAAATSVDAAAIVRGLLEGLPKGAARRGSLELAQTPAVLARLLASDDATLVGLAEEVLAAIAIVAPTTQAPRAEYTAEQRRSLTAGERIYGTLCAACHQLDGNGMGGLAPPLRESEWVAGPAEPLVRIVLHGVKGPLQAAGQAWDREMPGQGHLDDGQVADVLSYVRAAFAPRTEDPWVAPKTVQQLRERHSKRREPWLAEELLR